MNKRVIAAMATVLLVSAGCGDDGTDDAATEPSPADTEQEEMATDEPEESPEETATDDSATDETETPAEETEPPGEDADVRVAETSLGTVLVNGEGMTLYNFDPDEQGASTCYDDCAANWPPVTVDGEPVAGEGVDEALLGTTERDDGSMQVTYNDWPLYLWVQDDEPGDVTGQGVDGVWWVVGPDGTPIRE